MRVTVPILALTMLITLIGGIGCVGKDKPIVIVATRETDGQLITLRKGDKLQVRLEENATTGYSWTVLNQNPLVCRQLSDEFMGPNSTLVGAPGIRVMTFEAIAPGDGVLLFNYLRPWEKDRQPAAKVTLPIRVSP